MRQSTTPVSFQRTTRPDRGLTMTSGRAGVVVPVGFIPLNRGDSLSGRVAFDIDLADMPRPLYNAVTVRVQAWCVPFAAHPRFGSYKDFVASYNQENIDLIGGVRAPVSLKDSSAAGLGVENSLFYRTLGLHFSQTLAHNMDLWDAYQLIWNFRAAAHSSKITRRDYAAEWYGSTPLNAFAPAFWPTTKFPNVVPDYEQALVVGAMNLDVAAGQLPVGGMGIADTVSSGEAARTVRETSGDAVTYSTPKGANTNVFLDAAETGGNLVPQIFAEMAGTQITTTLAGIDKARETQAFAQARASMSGNDATGYENDNMLMAELMSGFTVPQELVERVWLLDDATVRVNLSERFASDGANLDDSITSGISSAMLKLNVPVLESGGHIMFTVEMLPERIQDRALDPTLHLIDGADYPDALRDTLRPEPVDMVTNERIDAAHTVPSALYGYEPMNNKWRRDFTRLGGSFFQADPASIDLASRGAIWGPRVVDPVFGEDHYMAPDDFPHDVFADTTADAFEVVVRHEAAVSGLTQFGDMLVEDNGEFTALELEQ